MRQPTIVYFHVTVLSLDSINEESMASYSNLLLPCSYRKSHLICRNEKRPANQQTSSVAVNSEQFFRHTLLTYSWRKAGVILDYVYRKT